MFESKESHSAIRQATAHTRNTVTYATDDTGHVNIISRFQQPAIDTATQDDEIGSTQQDIHMEIFPEERRFKLPETPAQNAKTRNLFEVEETTPTTPQLPANPFARQATQDNLAMGLSQVFNATQAPSSPTAARLPVVPSSDRPSPGIQIANVLELPSDMTTDPTSPTVESARRPRTAPSICSSSQPSRTPFQRAVTQPHTKYISRQISQEERKKRAQTEAASSPLEKDDELADRLFSDETEVTQSNKRRRTRLGFEAVASSIKAPPRAAARTSVRNPRAKSIQSAPNKQNEPQIIDISDGPTDSSEEETEPEEAAYNALSGSGDDKNDENKENRHVNRAHVPMTGVTIKRRQHTHVPHHPSNPSVSRFTRPQEQGNSRNGMTNTRDPSLPKSVNGQSTKLQDQQPVTIADSQASQKPSQSNGSTLNPGGATSSNASKQVVPQSQAAKISSNPEILASGARRKAADSSQQSLTPPPSSPPKEAENFLSSVRSPIRSRDLTGKLADALGSSPPVLKHSAIAADPSSVQVRVVEQEKIQYGTTEAETPVGSRNVMVEETSPAAVNSDPYLQSKHDSLPETARTPSSRINRLPSTVPETLSHPSLDPNLLKEATLVSSNVEENVAKIIAQYPIVKNQGSSSLQSTAESPTQARSYRSHQDTGSPSKPKNSVPTTPKRASPRKPRPFTAITAEVQSPDQSSVNEVVNLFVGDLGFQEQITALDSSPIGPARKRRRRNVIIPGSSSVKKPAASLNSIAANVAQFSQVPTSEQEDELAQGLDVAHPIPRRLSISRLTNARALPGLSQKQSRGKGNVHSVVEDEAPKTLKAKNNIKSNAKAVETQALPIASQDAPRAQEPVSEAPDPETVNEASNSQRISLRVQTVTAPFRVFAMWKGSPQAFFPATCLGPSAGAVEHRYQVRWDDGSITETNGLLLRRLELQKGDCVKVDHRKGQAYTVVGLQRGLLSGEAGSDSEVSLTDIFGNSQVKLRAKGKTGSKGGQADEIIAIKDLYLTKSLWASTLNGRGYTHPPSYQISSGLQTPMNASSTPSTPQSRSRIAKLASNLSSHQRAIFASKSSLQQALNLFSNVIFAMTSVGSVRDQVQGQIEGNGGTLLSETFAELFETPAPERLPANTYSSLSSTPPPSAHSHNGNPFTLKGSAATARFAVLLADSHCRTTKYFEALALGIPCIHSRWVPDCVKANRLLDWRPYLLPSGESIFLYDAVCSRSLAFHHNGGQPVALGEMINARGKWLDGVRVLLVKGGKKSEKVMDAYVFIAYALGAMKVGVAASRAEAERVLRQQNGKKDGDWDWICLYEEEEKGGGQSRKRKRGSSIGNAGGRALLLPSASISALGKCTDGRVVSTEFVVQSLILGRLFDE